jgi:hypothetical protein
VTLSRDTPGFAQRQRLMGHPDRGSVSAPSERWFQRWQTCVCAAVSVSALNQRLDASLAQFADRPLVEPFSM